MTSGLVFQDTNANSNNADAKFQDQSLLWSLHQVLLHVPISRSAWLSGVRRGIYPRPVKLSIRRVAWRPSDICNFVESLQNK